MNPEQDKVFVLLYIINNKDELILKDIFKQSDMCGFISTVEKFISFNNNVLEAYKLFISNHPNFPSIDKLHNIIQSIYIHPSNVTTYEYQFIYRLWTSVHF